MANLRVVGKAERVLLGMVMTVLAFVIERQLRRSSKQDQPKRVSRREEKEDAASS